MKKKIILISNSFWNFYNFRLPLLNLLKKEFNIYLIATEDKYRKKLKKLGYKTISIKLNPVSISLFDNFMYLIKIFGIIKKNKPSLIINYTIKPNFICGVCCIILKVKYILNITGLGSFFLRKNIFTHIFKIIFKYILRKSKLVIFQNKDDKLYFKVKTQNQIILPSLGTLIEKKKIIKKNKVFNFLFCGRVIEDKGAIEFFKAAIEIKKKYHDIKVNFNVCGSIDKNRKEKKILYHINHCKQNKIINFFGHRNNIKEFIKKNDCVVLPSYREGASKVLMEALALSKPIITTNVAGCKNFITRNTNGFLIKPNNSHELILAMKKMMNLSNVEYNKMCTASFRLAKQKYDQQKILMKNYLMIKKILQRR